MTRYRTSTPSSCSVMIAGCIVHTIIFSLLLWWYSHLWLTSPQLTFWKQALPLAAIMSPFMFILLHKDNEAPLKPAIGLFLALLFISSIGAQAAIWLGILKAPIF